MSKLTLVTLTTIALLASACGSTSDTSATSAPAAGQAFPVRVEHKYGTAEITKAPSRVVTLGLSDQDAVLALGIRRRG
jgi:iron complex transport system substrate-binding protein